MGGSSISTNGDSPRRGTGTCQHPGGVQPPPPTVTRVNLGC